MRYDISLNDFTERDQHPACPAVIGSDGNLSWGELQERVLSLSLLLEELKVHAGHPVIIYGHKQTGFVVAMIALMRMNIPYVPVDINVPVERIKKIKEISGSELLINFTNQEDFGFGSVIHKGKIIRQDKQAAYAPIPFDPADLLRYIIFTSGSTGEPKGVLIAAQALREFVSWTETDFKLKTGDTFINIAPFSFDLSVFEFFSFLHLGAALLLNTSAEAKKTEILYQRINAHKGSIWVSTPSFVYMLLADPDFNSKQLPSIRAFMFCGEILPRRTVEMLHDRFPGAGVYNPYGPTEATCCTTNIDVTPEVLNEYKEVPIGFAKPGSEVFILNEENDPAVPGEIIIAGNHVAHGYLNRPDLTEERFFVHLGKRAYRTGDLGFYSGKVLFYLGRNDDQVKLHGFRIELEEISSQIAQVKGVKDAVTIALKRGDQVKKLISFVVPDAGVTDTCDLLNEVKIRLSANLPEYMMPGDFSFVENFPYSSSHKIDKKELENRYLSQHV